MFHKNMTTIGGFPDIFVKNGKLPKLFLDSNSCPCYNAFVSQIRLSATDGTVEHHMGTGSLYADRLGAFG